MSFDDLPASIKAKKFFCIYCREVVDRKFMSQSNNVCNICFNFHIKRRLGDDFVAKKI